MFKRKSWREESQNVPLAKREKHSSEPEEVEPVHCKIDSFWVRIETYDTSEEVVRERKGGRRAESKIFSSDVKLDEQEFPLLIKKRAIPR